MADPRAGAAPVAASVDELLAGATTRQPLEHGDAKSGARFERAVIDGEPFVVKYLWLDDDWTRRAVGDLGCKTLQLWRAGLLHRLPACINQPIVAVADEPDRRLTTLLMCDVGPWLVPEGAAVIPLEQHLGFLDHMAQVQASFWGFEDTIGLTPMTNRYFELSPWTAEVEAALGSDALVPRLIAEGWSRFPERARRAADVVMPLTRDPGPLVAALARTPTTFLHGNWKLGNLGTDGDGRTVLIDWEAPGAGPACSELTWYVAINCDRLPHSKRAAMDAYRSALERHGVDTAPWWDAQLALSLLGSLVHFGWEKALGDDTTELAWWEERAVEGARYLD